MPRGFSVVGLCLLGLLGIGCEMTPRYQTPATRENVLERIWVRSDNVEGFRWYSHRSSILGPYGSPVELYIGQSIDQPRQVWLRMRTYWRGERWSFFDGITVRADGVRHDLNGLTFERDMVASGSVRVIETTDLLVGKKERALIQAIIASNTAVMRFRGERGFYDYKFTANDRLIFQDVLTAFSAIPNTASTRSD